MKAADGTGAPRLPPARARAAWREARAAVLALVLAVQGLDGQEPGWAVTAGIGYGAVNGAYEAIRANGKRVVVDMVGGPTTVLGAEVPLGAWRLAVGVARTSGVVLSVDQRFPDGGAHRGSDRTSSTAVFVALPVRIVAGDGWQLQLLPSAIAYSWSPVAIPSAGPPWDRSLPLDLDPDLGAGIGVSVRGLLRMAPGWSVGGEVGLVRQRFAATIVDDVSQPGIGGDVDLDANPLTFLTVLRWSPPRR